MPTLQEAKRSFDEHGFVILKDVFNKDMLAEIESDLIQLMKTNDATVVDEDVNKCWNSLRVRNRRAGSNVYNAFKRLPSVHRLSVEKSTMDILSRVAGIKFPAIVDANCRIDSSGEEQFLFDWHQDYWFSVCSTNAVVAWVPLLGVCPNVGGLDVVSNLETAGRIYDTRANKKYTTYADAVILDEPIPSERALTLDNLDAGDMLLFKFSVLHRSNAVLSREKSRFTMQFRYSDFEDEEFQNHAYKPGVVNDTKVDYLNKGM